MKIRISRKVGMKRVILFKGSEAALEIWRARHEQRANDMIEKWIRPRGLPGPALLPVLALLALLALACSGSVERAPDPCALVPPEARQTISEGECFFVKEDAPGLCELVGDDLGEGLCWLPQDAELPNWFSCREAGTRCACLESGGICFETDPRGRRKGPVCELR